MFVRQLRRKEMRRGAAPTWVSAETPQLTPQLTDPRSAAFIKFRSHGRRRPRAPQRAKSRLAPQHGFRVDMKYFT
jgi:hypothetical protein